MEGIIKYFPPDLSADPDRLDVLYAPFRDKSVNPKGYESKLSTWQDAIKQYMRINKTPVIEVEEVMRAFTFDGKSPRCINQVLIESIQNKNVVSEVEYCNSLHDDERGWLPWAVGLGFNYLVKKPVSMTLSWAWMSIVGSGSSSPVKGNFISGEMVEELSEGLQRLLGDPAFRERLTKNGEGIGGALTGVSSSGEDAAAVEFEVLRRETSSVANDEKTLSILLAHLQRKGKVRMSKLTIGDEEKTFVFLNGHRAAADNAPTTTSLFSTPLKNEPTKKTLTEKEKTLIQLDVTAKKLVHEIETIHGEMTQLQERAKEYLAKGIKPLALNALKRKKMLQGKVDAREKSLDNVQVMISKLQDVDSNKMVFAAYKDAVAALNKSLSEADVDSIDDTMDDMREALEKQAEVEEALAGRNLRGVLEDEEDEDELELELERILDESQNDEEPKGSKVEVELPDVPTDDVEALLDKLCISPVKTETAEKRLPQLAL